MCSSIPIASGRVVTWLKYSWYDRSFIFYHILKNWRSIYETVICSKLCVLNFEFKAGHLVINRRMIYTHGHNSKYKRLNINISHYSDAIMGAMASQITSLTIVYSGADQRKHQSSMSLSFERGIHRWPATSPHKWPVIWKMFYSMTSSCVNWYLRSMS